MPKVKFQKKPTGQLHSAEIRFLHEHKIGLRLKKHYLERKLSTEQVRNMRSVIVFIKERDRVNAKYGNLVVFQTDRTATNSARKSNRNRSIRGYNTESQ